MAATTALALVPVGVAGVAGAGAAGAGSGGRGGYDPPPVKASNYARHVTNRWFPLRPGTVLTYTGVKDGKRAREVLRVTHRTKSFNGVRATVLTDRLYLNGKLGEDTVDWYAQDRRGDVVYLGERTRALDKNGRLTDTAGSWQHGVDGARAGIFMPAHPKVGQVFLQEHYKGHAEDHFKILSKRAHVRVPWGSSSRALRTLEWTPLEPGVRSHKLYVRGVGTVAEADVPSSSEHLELVSVKHGR
jgi:hypothetical protein